MAVTTLTKANRELGGIETDAMEAKGSKYHFYNAAETIFNIVNRTVSKSLVGRSLSRDDIWLQVSMESTINTGMLCRQLQPYPALLRPLVYLFMTSRRKLKHNSSVAQELISPVIKSRQCHEENMDILQWLMDVYEQGDLSQSTPFLTKQILFLATAATRSTATSIVNTLFDLLAYPHCQELLREEIGESVSDAGGWSLASVQNMKRLDSFIKESQRLNHHVLRKHIRAHICLANSRGLPYLQRVTQLIRYYHSQFQPQSTAPHHSLERCDHTARDLPLYTRLLGSQRPRAVTQR